MERFTILQKDTYVDSLASLFTMSVLMDCEGVENAYAGMATPSSKQMMEELGLADDAVLKAGFCTAMSGSSFLVLAIAASNASRPDARTAITKSFSPAPRTASSASPSSSIICLLEGVAMPA